MSEPKRMFPIQDGPSVPWEVMAPHEAMSQKNHSQSIARIAERGGFGAGEAWCIVNGITYKDMPHDKAGWDQLAVKWREYAERINLHYADLTAALARAERAEKENLRLKDRIAQLEKVLGEIARQLKFIEHDTSDADAHDTARKALSAINGVLTKT